MNGASVVYLLISLLFVYAAYSTKDQWFRKEDFQQGAKLMVGLAFLLIAMIGIAVALIRR